MPRRPTCQSPRSARTYRGATLDLFYDEDLAYAARLKDARVPCEVKVVPGAFHGFDVVARGASVTLAFYDGQCAFLRDARTPTSSAPR